MNYFSSNNFPACFNRIQWNPFREDIAEKARGVWVSCLFRHLISSLISIFHEIFPSFYLQFQFSWIGFLLRIASKLSILGDFLWFIACRPTNISLMHIQTWENRSDCECPVDLGEPSRSRLIQWRNWNLWNWRIDGDSQSRQIRWIQKRCEFYFVFECCDQTNSIMLYIKL